MKRVCWWLLAGVCAICMAGSASAGVIPYGVQNDVPLDTILNDWGWTIVYRGNYSDGSWASPISMDTMFGGVGEYVMLAGIQDGSSTVDVLAAALTSEASTYTPLNTPHVINGAEWYCNGYSLGFAGLGDTIYQTQADTNGGSERDRLSWHAVRGNEFDYNSFPTGVIFGWRSGSNVGLNDNPGWDRLVLTYTGEAGPSVPAPAAVLLGTFGAGLVGWMRRRRAL